MIRKRIPGIGTGAMAAALCLLLFAASAPAQSRRAGDRYGDKLIDIKVGEVVLEAINFGDQTASLSVGLDITNSLIPISLKDFEYRLSLYGLETIEGSHDGVMKLGGKRPSRVNLPLTINLRSIPGVVWTAFRNQGRLQFDLDTGFTIPLFLFERRFDKSFSGEVPLKTLVDAASLIRASKLGDLRIDRR